MATSVTLATPVARGGRKVRRAQASDLVIAGIVPMSSVDWPGKLVTTVFLQGCPWTCLYCHNCALIDPRTPGEASYQQLIDLLARRRGLLDGVVFTGGEPCRQAALLPAIDAVRSLGFSVGLHTGGAFPLILEQALPKIDWIGLDIKALPVDYEEVVGRPGAGNRAWKALEMVLESGIDYEVRTTVAPESPIIARFAELAALLRERGVEKYAVQQARATGTTSEFQVRMAEVDPQEWEKEFSQVARQAQAAGFPQLEIRAA